MEGIPLDVVEVFCPLEECRRRNIARGDRGENQSREQAEIMAQNIAYAMRVETHLHTPEECAEQMIRTLYPQGAPGFMEQAEAMR